MTMKKLLTSVCFIAIGAAIGMSLDLKQAAAMPPLSIGMMYPTSTQNAPTFSRAELISTSQSAILTGGTAKSFAVTSPAGAELLVVAVMTNYSTDPNITDEPVPTLNGAGMTIVAESRRSKIAWASVLGGLNYTIGWGSSVQMVGSAVHCWWFKNVSKVSPVIGGRRDPTGLATSAQGGCFSGSTSSLEGTVYRTRFHMPTSLQPYIIAVTSVPSKSTQGTWGQLNLSSVKPFFQASVLTAAVATNSTLGSATGVGTVGFRLANSGAEQFQQMSMCEVVGKTTGYPELHTGPWRYDPSTIGATKTFSAVGFGPAPVGMRRLVVVAGQETGRAAALTSMTIAGVPANIRVIKQSNDIWGLRGCFIGWAEIQAGTSGDISCTYVTNGGATCIQVYSIYSPSSLTELFGQSRDNSGGFTTQSGQWRFVITSAVSEGIGYIDVNGDYQASTYSVCAIAANTQSGGIRWMSGAICTNVNTGPFTIGLVGSGDPCAGVMSVFG